MINQIIGGVMLMGFFCALVALVAHEAGWKAALAIFGSAIAITIWIAIAVWLITGQPMFTGI